ncbi:hypothetical protein V2A60_002817 [Cordyceps javanica]|uniref:Uncharacterized protein n=1 Tax=Cordyceps javanica TaxID=43265 RepID=A0A545UXE0_9HYPO|nr:hypothetical protein IF1G_07000 [Cordyceps javanica]TQW05997.1 hypothetical protein IF2G_06280 [Cordyceps javanica]
MDYTYDSKALNLPDSATTGGSASNFDREQAVFYDEIGCLDAKTFSEAASEAANVSESPAAWTYKCIGKCKRPAGGCVEHLRAQVAALRATADDVAKKHSNGVGLINNGSGLLFPGKQKSAGCSRSPAWDGLEESSPWFPGKVSGVPAPNFSALFGVYTQGFVLVDYWERIKVSKLDGTISYAATDTAWRLKGVEVQCVDDDEETEPWATQTSLEGGREGRFKYQCQMPRLGTAQDTLAEQLFAIGALRNARVLSAVMCCVELYHTAAKLLEMRDITMRTGRETRVGGLRTTMDGVVFTKVALKGDQLPPKLSGYATSPTPDFEDLCRREGATGAMRNTSVMAMSLGYDRGVYGGSIAGMWAVMDSGFMYDYSTGNFSRKLGRRIGDAFAAVRAQDTGNAALNAHLLDVVTVIACNFTALKAKAALEDRRKLRSRPCMAVWDDLAAAARYRMADAAFAHVWYDSPNDMRSLVLGGLGCALHDLIDVGPDVACGEVSNLIPSLTGGDLSAGALRAVYVGLVAALEWCAEHDPFNTTGLAILFTHWWQLCNLRHRPVALMSRVAPSPAYAVCPEKLAAEPTFACITRGHGLRYVEGQAVLDDQRAELARVEAALAAAGVTDLDGLIRKLVRPVLDYADGKDTRLPVEVAYCTDVLDANLAREHSHKIRALWALMLIMWKSGAVWMAVLANTQYSHQGLTNCDRGRDDYSASTWGKAIPGADKDAGAGASGSGRPESSSVQWLMSKARRLAQKLWLA